jgi:hypothetical protein
MRRRQAGQTLVMFALTLAFVFVGLIALIGDAAVMLYQYTQANSAALVGVQAGAATVDLKAFYNGTQQLDVVNGPANCKQAAEQVPGVTALCRVTTTANGQQSCITANVTKTVSLPLPIPGANPQVQITRTGQAVFGGQAPSNVQPCP